MGEYIKYCEVEKVFSHLPYERKGSFMFMKTVKTGSLELVEKFL
jgi:hypothetical protein